MALLTTEESTYTFTMLLVVRVSCPFMTVASRRRERYSQGGRGGAASMEDGIKDIQHAAVGSARHHAKLANTMCVCGGGAATYDLRSTLFFKCRSCAMLKAWFPGTVVFKGNRRYNCSTSNVDELLCC